MNLSFPFHFDNEVGTLPSYATFENRISSFSDVSTIGNDASGTYSMYRVRLGNTNRPPIMIVCGLHGSEWHTCVYTMKLMEMLRDRTFPDTAFREKLLNNYHVVFLPVVNPWGFDRAEQYGPAGRRNSNDVDLNRDFYDFTQTESQNVKAAIESVKPFACIDAHMFGEGYESAAGHNMIIGHGDPGVMNIRDTIARSWHYYSRESVHRWSAPSKGTTYGLLRTFAREQSNPWTKYTLSYITEMVRPQTTDTNNNFTEKQITENGIVSMYLYLKTSMLYYETRNASLR